MERNVYTRADYAGLWLRTRATMVDGTFLGLLFAIAGRIFDGPSATLAQCLIGVLYKFGFTYKSGTPGYQLLGIKIVSLNGERITIGQTLVRCVSSMFSLVPLGLGFFWIAVDPNKRAWHDLVAGTYVVRSSALPVRRERIEQHGLVRMYLLVLQLFCAAGVAAGVFFWMIQPAVSRGRAAIDEFHRLYEGGQYDIIYDSSDPELKAKLSRELAIARLAEIQQKFGKVIDVGYACHSIRSDSRRKVLRIEYTVRFEHGLAWETYDWQVEGEQHRLLAYAVEAFENNKPDWEAALAPAGVRPNDATCGKQNQPPYWWERSEN